MIDKVRFWVEEILEANRRDHTTAQVGMVGDQRGPFRSARALAMAMMAMHDAHAAVTGASAPYRAPSLPAPPGAEAEAAAAAAAHTVLQTLYPRQAALLWARWQAYAARYGAGGASQGFGTQVGLDHIAARAGDATFLGEVPYAPTGPYEHDADPLSPGQGFFGTKWGGAPPFLAGMTLQPLAPPAGRTGPHAFVPDNFYAAEFEEVMRFGALTSAVRTPEQEETGLFWAYDGAEEIGTPPRLYIQVALAVLDARGPLSPTALLEALSACAVALADAGIQAWHYKYDAAHMLWRPVLGIRRAQPLPGTPRDPWWIPLGKPDTNTRHVGSTPDFPAYPSGHATFGAACFETLRRWIRTREGLGFGDGDADTIGFSLVSDELNGRNTDPRDGLPRRRVTRHYAGLWDAIRDNSESRIWLGVHWRMDGISKRDTMTGKAVHGRPANPGEVGDVGGVHLGLGIAGVVAAKRGF